MNWVSWGKLSLSLENPSFPLDFKRIGRGQWIGERKNMPTELGGNNWYENMLGITLSSIN